MQSLNTTSLAASFLALNSIINDERQTPTPPTNKGIAALGGNQRKRKTPTPPQTMQRLSAKNYAALANQSPAKAATTLAPLPPIMPMITGVHSMAAAGATPPLQLMATPPHNLGAFMGLNEQLMINPHLIPTGLPPNTTITAHPNPNQNNINNNFKIHLPFNKPSSTTTPSPVASPSPAAAPKTPSPQLTPSPQPGRMDKTSRRIKPTTLLKSTDESWQRHKQNDKQLTQRTPISLTNDVVIEMLPPATTESPKSISASSSRHHTPMTSPTTPKSQKSPDVIMLTTPTDHNAGNDCDTVLDLTHSPDKVKSNKPLEIVDLVNTPEQQKQQINGEANKAKPDKKPDKPPPPPPKPPLEPEYEELIKACREADPSKDMEKLIKTKLLKYYYEVHGDFVKSKSFRKSIRKVVESIKAKPDLVYYNLKTIVEELKVRRKARVVEEASAAAASAESSNTAANNNNNNTNAVSPSATAENVEKTTTTISDANVPASSSTSNTSSTAVEISATATTSTGNKKLDEQIKKLNKALYVLTKRIEVLEQAEVDWDDDDSSFLQVERFKKRACQIYEKICDLTGESKNAHRLVKKPIKFNETRIPQFNKTLQAFINRTKEFPDYYDVLRMLEHCNRTYSLGLVNFEMKNIAEDAFIKVGKLLQSRRKADLYETVTHYAGDGADPAKTDPTLAAKLNENLKNHKKINDILEKFARKQDMPEVEEEEEKAETAEDTKVEESAKAEVKMETETAEVNTNANESLNKEDKKQGEEEKQVLLKSEECKKETETVGLVKMLVNEEGEEEEDDEEEDDDEEEEDDEDNLDEQVETLANGDVSDNESDNEMENVNNKNKENVSKDSKKLNESLVSVNDSIEILEKSDDKSLSTECIEIPDNSQDILQLDNTMENCMDKLNANENNNSARDNLLLNNNNNELLAAANTKTVITTNASKETSPLTSPKAPPTPASIMPIRNGKLRETPTPHLLNNNNNNNASINLDTATATLTTTTTTADLKIVHVSSLEPDTNNITTTTTGGSNIEVGSNLCTDLTSTISANKSLEEIVISDEES
ncbi:daxx-like protein [Lucilia sericata]|uniref:daxx-like protein n=1 Tax=Lucilia sericata TaxID=13632 RepID=UPI0018A7F640|nr:daxx-like protein [Lucilia sericata]